MRAIGLRVRSGLAVVVLVEGLDSSWRVLESRQVVLCADDGPYARFPFHPLVQLQGEAAVLESRKAVASVRKTAQRELSLLLEAIGPLEAAGIVAGSLADPDSISNPHIRAHAREGQLFRQVIASALKGAGIATELLSDRDVLTRLASRQGRPLADLNHALAQAGRGAFRPWTTHEKLAAAGALWNLC
jgi:hypothetical protein